MRPGQNWTSRLKGCFQILLKRHGLYPRPPIPVFTEQDALACSSRVWNKVCVPGSTPSESDVEWMSAIVRKFPTAYNYGTHTLVLYRAGKYESAIEAAQKAVELSGDEGTSPINFAVIAMSHFQLRDKAKANESRAQFDEAMKQDAYTNNAACLDFVKEVEALLDREQE